MKSYFLNKAQFEQYKDGRNFVLLCVLAFVSKKWGRIEVPAGFKTDLASVPRMFWRIFPPFGKYTDAAILHDWLYRNGMFNREACDSIFLEAMTALKVGWFTRHTIYRMVRIFGGSSYKGK